MTGEKHYYLACLDLEGLSSDRLTPFFAASPG